MSGKWFDFTLMDKKRGILNLKKKIKKEKRKFI